MSTETSQSEARQYPCTADERSEMDPLRRIAELTEQFRTQHKEYAVPLQINENDVKIRRSRTAEEIVAISTALLLRTMGIADPPLPLPDVSIAEPIDSEGRAPNPSYNPRNNLLVLPRFVFLEPDPQSDPTLPNIGVLGEELFHFFRDHWGGIHESLNPWNLQMRNGIVQEFFGALGTRLFRKIVATQKASTASDSPKTITIQEWRKKYTAEMKRLKNPNLRPKRGVLLKTLLFWNKRSYDDTIDNRRQRASLLKHARGYMWAQLLPWDGTFPTHFDWRLFFSLPDTRAQELFTPIAKKLNASRKRQTP